MYGQSGVNHAANLPAADNKDIQKLMNRRVSNYIIRNYHYTLPINLFLRVTADVDLCDEILYLCESDDNLPQFSGTAMDAAGKRQTLTPPKVISFSGFCVERMEVKLAADQLTCINRNAILRDWFNKQLSRAIEYGKDAIMRRFYRELLVRTAPENSGNDAGFHTRDQVLGTLAKPVLFDATNADLWFTSMLEVIKQMPHMEGDFGGSEFGMSTQNAFLFGPSGMEQVLMQVDNYMSYDKVGACAACALFSDTFTHKPRGIMPITSRCIESYECDAGGTALKIYRVLFGKRYIGAAAQLRVATHNYQTEDGESYIYKTKIYHHMHVYDCRYLGQGAIVVKANQPQTIDGCVV